MITRVCHTSLIMAVFRVEPDGKARLIDIDPKLEKEFVALNNNSNAKVRFVYVENYPDTPYKDCYVYDFEHEIIQLDEDCVLNHVKQETAKKIEDDAEQMMFQVLSEKDWCKKDYTECINELQATITNKGNKIFYMLKKRIPDITRDEIAFKIASWIAGEYTEDDLIQEMKNKGFTDEEIQSFLKLFTELAIASKLFYWTEEVQDYVEQVQKQILEAQSVDEVKQIVQNISYPELS